MTTVSPKFFVDWQMAKQKSTHQIELLKSQKRAQKYKESNKKKCFQGNELGILYKKLFSEIVTI